MASWIPFAPKLPRFFLERWFLSPDTLGHVWGHVVVTHGVSCPGVAEARDTAQHPGNCPAVSQVLRAPALEGAPSTSCLASALGRGP